MIGEYDKVIDSFCWTRRQFGVMRASRTCHCCFDEACIGKIRLLQIVYVVVFCCCIDETWNRELPEMLHWID